MKTQLLALGVLALSGSVYAQTPPPTQGKEEPKKEQAKQEESEYKKYEDVITKKAVSQDGLFKVHRIDDKVFWEIPEEMLGRELLWQTEMAGLPTNTAYLGMTMNTNVVCFTRRGKKLFMRKCDYSVRAVGDEGTKLGVEQSTMQPIIHAFDISTEGKGSNGKATAVVEVTSLFTSDPPDFAARGAVGGGGVDGNRSYIDRVKAFPKNIETRSMLTFTAGQRQQTFNPFGGAGSGGSASTALVHYSLVLLPEKPMTGRLKDSRIGYFTVGFDEYGRRENKRVERQYISRFRLEKKNPEAEVSEPVKPIVFYISREVPTKWREALKKGVEDWKPAFEQAGFKNAIIAKDAPSVKEDPNWDPEDARYSVIRWAPSPIQNAMGPSVQDPRSGETISAHIIFWNNITELVENWYFAQCAAIDPKARKLPMDDDLMQELVRYVAAHEVGHTLGLEHNMKASAWYTVQQLRDPKFTAENGVSCSIMDYSRFNYVAQPGDGVTRTIGMIGPYDKFAIEYGYKPILNADDPDDEKPTLDQILARQVTDPRVRFGNYRFSQDPTTQSEDIGSDAIAAGMLGLKNIDRIATMYLWEMGTPFGEDYNRLAALRSELMGQRMTELFHAMRLVGGVVETDYHAGRGGDVFKPVDAATQRGAALFLLDNGLELPKSLMNPRVVNKIRPDGVINETTSTARTVLNGLLADSRVQRMFDNEAARGPGVYTVKQLVSDITRGVFPELQTAAPHVGVYRRAVHRAYLDTMDRKVNGTRGDLTLVAKAELRGLAHSIDKAIPKSKDAMTQMHLQETRKSIEKIMNGKYSVTAAAAPNPFQFLFIKPGESGLDCWTRPTVDPDLLQEIEKIQSAGK